jgi:deoxyribonuclease-4
MPLFGAHMSIAGGCHHAIAKAVEHGCETVQLFTKNSNQWKAKELSDDEVALFRKALRQAKLKFPTAHDSYLINLASPDADLFNRSHRSLEAFVIEMERAERLGLTYLVMHPGSPCGSDEGEGLARVAKALDEVHRRCAGFRVKVLLENTAGQGSCLGHRFEHLATILSLLKEPARVGVCFDTCHAFAAGYALAPEADYRATFDEFDDIIGLKRLKCFHVNDSKKARGSRVDRHEHIGRGFLGLEPFRLLVNDPRFQKHPMIQETPKEEGDNEDMDAVNLATLRGLVNG